MAVNLTDLSLPQLEGLKTQLDQEIEFLTSSIGQLKVAQTKFVEAKDSLNVLNKNNEGKELLVPLTSSMYVPGSLNDVGTVLVDVGTGYYVEKKVEDAKAFFKRKIEFLTKQIEKIQPTLQEKHAMKQAVIEVMNVKIQQLQQSQQASQMSGEAVAGCYAAVLALPLPGRELELEAECGSSKQAGKQQQQCVGTDWGRSCHMLDERCFETRLRDEKLSRRAYFLTNGKRILSYNNGGDTRRVKRRNYDGSY
ncbi:uncharacterized protein V6R79_014796 [Siganus canaliculatus]